MRRCLGLRAEVLNRKALSGNVIPRRPSTYGAVESSIKKSISRSSHSATHSVDAATSYMLEIVSK